MAANWTPVGAPQPIASAPSADRWKPVGEARPLDTGGFHVAGVRQRPQESEGSKQLKREQPGDYDPNSPEFKARYGTTALGSLGESLGEDFALPTGADVATSVRAGLARVPQGAELQYLEERRRQKLGQVRNESGDLGMPILPDIPRGEVLDYRTTPAQRRALQADPEFQEIESDLEDVRGAGREISKDEQAIAERNPGFWQKATLGAATSTALSAPALAVGIATRSPALAVGTMWPTTKASSYARYREEGLNEAQASLHANLDAVLEVGTEAMPMQALLKPGTAAFRRFMSVVGAELPGETVAQIGQSLSAHIATLPGETTLGDWTEGIKQGVIELPETLASVFMSAGAQTGAVQLAERGRNRQNAAAPPAPRRAPRTDDAQDGTAPAAEASAGPAAEAGQDGAAVEQGGATIERYQLQRQRGELLGRQYEVRPLTEEAFQYLLKPSLPKGHANTLDEYRQKHPTITHVRVERSPGQKDWKLSKAGTAETLRPDGEIAREVPDFDTPQAKQWAALDGEKSQRVDSDRLDTENDSVLTAIAKLGGISREEAEQNGIDPASFGHRGHRISLTFRKGGLSLDQMAEALAEFGYPVKDAKGGYDPNVLLDLIDTELRGGKPRSDQSGMDDEIARLEQKGAEGQALAEPVTVDDLLTHYANYPGAVEDDSDLGALHEPEFYPPDFDPGAKKLADLAELAQMIDPDAVESALAAGTDAEAARRLWSIVNGESVDATTDLDQADDEVTDLTDDIGEVAAAEVPAGQEQPLPRVAVPEDSKEPIEDESLAARPEPASSPLPPPQDETVGATPGGRSDEGEVLPKPTQTDPQAAIDAAAHEAATSPQNDRPLPSAEQKEAENYKAGAPIRLHGHTVRVENPKDSYRTNYDPKAVEALGKYQFGKAARQYLTGSLAAYKDGDAKIAVELLRAAADSAKAGLSGTAPLREMVDRVFVNKMAAHYGRVLGTLAPDGDHIDIFLGPQAADETLPVFVIDTNKVAPGPNKAARFTNELDEFKIFAGWPSREAALADFDASYDKGFAKGITRAVRQMTPDEFRAWLDEPKPAEVEKPAATPKRETAPALTVPDGLPAEAADMAKAMDAPKTEVTSGGTSEPTKSGRSETQAGVSRLDQDEGALRSDNRKERSPISRERDRGVPGVGEQLSGVPGGDRAEAESSALGRPNQGQSGIPARQRPLGDTERAGLQYERVQIADDRRSDVDGQRVGGTAGIEKTDVVRAPEPGNGPKAGVRTGAAHGQEEQPVSDAQRGDINRGSVGRSARDISADDGGTDTQKDTGPDQSEMGRSPPAEKSLRLAQWVAGRLKNRTTFSWAELFQHANFHFAGTQAQGKYTPKDAYDAVELGMNLYLRSIGMKPGPTNAAQHIENLEKLLELIPTQTKRTEEQDEFQQFSTPPHYSYVASWVADIRAGESVLEPSAGIGGLAVFASNAGAKVVANELSQRRAALLSFMGFEQVFHENAEQLNNILPASVQPTLILMNPPFSATAGREQGKRSTSVGAQHVTQALQRLQPGGRLVAIVGEGMADDRAAFAGWWRDIKGKYDVRANVGIDGSGYRKYGTTFDNQILVIDKRPPGGASVVTGKVKNVADLLPLLEGIRNERPAETKQSAIAPPAESGGRPAAATRVEKPADAASSQPDAVGTTGGRGTRGVAVTRPAVPGSAGELRQSPGAVEPAKSDAVADVAAQREREPASRRRTEPSEIPAGGVAPAAGSPARSAGGDSRLAFEQTTAIAGEMTGSIFEQYTPQRVKIAGAKAHPGKLVQSSAMASVLPPAATYMPNLPKDVTADGLLSDAQLEAVIYAGQMHQQLMADGARKGYFIGDGTGVGKGREISGIILDNLRQGRTKAIWMSEKQGLIRDAQRDFAGVGADPSKIFWHGTAKASEEITAKDGVLFSTYATLRSAEKKTGEGQAPKTRLQQLIDWAGPDFDGVIVFDESHNAGNAVTIKSKRGGAEPSRQALAVVDLQKALPNARVVYVSATGATELHNLSYATRLGLWGEGTPFSDVREFINQISQGGLAAMELVARDMKQMGVYTARSLSFDGVTYDRIQHDLTDIQREIYDELALAWQSVLKDVVVALEETGGNKNRNAKSAAMSAFWGSHQRFFNQVITAMQMPSVLDDIEKRMAAGDAIVLQLVNTNEAIQERKLASMGEQDDIDDLDMTPRENLIQYIKNSFPVVQYESFVDENGTKQSRPVTDSEGNTVLNAQAVAARDALLEKLDQIRVPEGPLEMILNQFGPKVVAEVTGRRRRVVRDPKGKNIIEARGRNAAAADAEQFMADKKRIMIFSDAGGTGYSFHADLTKKNQRKRSHYLIQPGWRANKAVQGFGRTHRTNQASAPEYILVTTDLAAQKRFVSSIARRLDQLGALTKGQRDTANQGMFSASDNLESEYAVDAVWDLFQDMYRSKIPELNFAEVTGELGLDLIDAEGKFVENKIPEVPKFLNRLLSLTRDRQQAVFGEFNKRMEGLVAAAIADGTYDAGMETLDAINVEVKREDVVHTDEKSSAQTKYVELELTRERRLEPFPSAATQKLYGMDFYRNKKSGRVWSVVAAGSKTTRKGSVETRFRMAGPTSERAGTAAELGFAGSNFEALTPEQARALWDAENETLGKTYTMPAHMITGAILPIWDRLEGRIRVVRTQSADGRRYLGRLVHPDDLEATLKRLNIDSALAKMAPKDVAKRIQAGDVVSLANGWRIFRSTVSNEKRIELRPGSAWLSESLKAELRNAGVFLEKIEWKERYFIPTGAAGHDVLAKVVKTRPIVDIQDIEKSDVAPSALSHISAETAAKQAEFREQVDLKRIRDHYTKIAQRWKGMRGRVIVRMNEYDIPWKYASNYFDNDMVGRVQGFLARDTGDIYLLPGNWTDASVGERLLFHEAEGHLSIEQFFGEEIVPYLNRVFLVDPAGVKRVGYEYGFYDADGAPTAKVNFSHRHARMRSADEYIARMAETVNSSSPKSLRRMWEWLVSHWAELMRQAGWRTYKPTEAEIRGFLGRAQRSLAKGGRDKSALSIRALERAAAVTAEKLDRKSPQHQLGLHPSWNSPEPSRADTWIQLLQDRHIDTRRVLEAISATSESGVTPEETNVYLQEELFHGRVAKRVQDFIDDELKPLLKAMESHNMDMFELNRYLHARHARERNEQIASINPDMPDGGSGMTTEDADAYLAGLSPAESQSLRELAGMVDGMIANSREMLVSYGLESPATIDIWQQTYAHYVPLNREDMDTSAPGTGQGYSVRGPASKRAMGSFRDVSNIIASIAQQREKYLVRGEKNRVANALVGLALENPNEDFWKVDAPPMLRYVSPTTGMVEEMVDPTYKSHDNIVVARIPDNKGNVREHVVVFNKDNERALRMSKALKNLDTDQIGIVLGAFAKVTRYFASINTQYNPIFGMVNLWRDLQEGMLTLTSTPLAGEQAAIAKLVVPALRGVYIETRERRSGNRRRSAWADLWEEFQQEGGQTGYRDMFNTGAERAEAIAKEIRHMTSKNPAGVAGRAVFNWLSDYNVAMENAVRLATYKVGLERGLSKRQAASIAKNLTVNFNRKGAWGSQAGALYAFFNASVQGTARVVETFLGPAGKKIAIGGIMVGVIQALMMAAAGFDEDDIPEFIQSTNLVLPLPGTDRKYLSLPYPLGFRFLPNLGRIATQYVMSGFKEAPRRVTEMLGVLIDNFNPIGNSGWSAQTIAPTAADPIVALGENRDWTGSPIALTDRDTLSPTPGHTRVKSSASAFSIELSRLLNISTGGTDYVPGIASPTPDQIDYLIGQATGGVGREALKTMQTVTSLFTGEQLPTYKIPLFGRLYGSAADQAGESRTFYNNVKKLNQVRNEIMGRAEDEKDFESYVDETPVAAMALEVNRIEKLVSDLRREKRRLKKAGAGREDIQEIDTQITEVLAEINRQVADMEKGQ